MAVPEAKGLIYGKYIRRYKRFFADFLLEDGSEITAHCPNPGRMTSCLGENWKSLLTKSSNPKRKLQYTWEMIYNGKSWIGINAARANEIVEKALKSGGIPEFNSYSKIYREYKVNNSRLDFYLEDAEGRGCFIEVKSVSYMEKGIYFFPDAVTKRGKRHLEELSSLKEKNYRSVIFFVVQRSDGKALKMARHVDPEYAAAMDMAVRNGVEILAWQCDVKPGSISLKKRLPVPEYEK